MQALGEMPNFDKTFVCDPHKPHKGFKCFDDFFTRKLQKDACPIAYSEDPYTVVNAFENTPYQIKYSIKQYGAFWIKTQPYSTTLLHNLAIKIRKPTTLLLNHIWHT